MFLSYGDWKCHLARKQTPLRAVQFLPVVTPVYWNQQQWPPGRVGRRISGFQARNHCFWIERSENRRALLRNCRRRRSSKGQWQKRATLRVQEKEEDETDLSKYQAKNTTTDRKPQRKTKCTHKHSRLQDEVGQENERNRVGKKSRGKYFLLLLSKWSMGTT